uniref:Trimethylguanosine synthase n=1 Tax=Strongyloides venezuelensis TaxID=75913 RepID=A0A0K0F680_STRVS
MSEKEYNYSFDWEEVLEATIQYESGISADVSLSKVYIYDDDLVMAGIKGVEDVEEFVKNYSPSDEIIISKNKVVPTSSLTGQNDVDPETSGNLVFSKKEIREKRKKLALELVSLTFSKYWKNNGEYLTLQSFINDFKENLDEDTVLKYEEKVEKIKPHDPYNLIKVHRDPILQGFSNISQKTFGLDYVNSLNWDDLYEEHRQLVKKQALMDFSEYKRTNIKGKCFSFLANVKKAKFVSGFDDSKYSIMDKSSDEEKNFDTSNESKDFDKSITRYKDLECNKGFEEMRNVTYYTNKPEFKLRILSLKPKGYDLDDTNKDTMATITTIPEEDRSSSESIDLSFDPIKDEYLIASKARNYINADNEMRKYWNQRFRLFSKLNHGILMDREGWFSVTPEKIAKHIAERMVKRKNMIIFDGFTGVGGNAIQFALKGAYVYAVEMDPIRLKCAKRNAEVYGVADRIQFFLGDFFKIVESFVGSRDSDEFCPSNKHIIDGVFLSPPWGGPEYLTKEVYDLKNDIPIDGFKVFEYSKKLSSNISYFLPRNTPIKQLISLAGPGGKCEIEHSVLNSKIKTLTAYYGNLIAST